MKIDWRVSAVAGGAAFILSVLTGVIGGVSFGTLILRALVMAVIFAAGAVGVSILIDRFLPELRRPSSAASDSGTSVDIVVEGEEDYGAAVDDRADADREFSSADIASGDDSENLSGDDEDELLEEVDESEEIGEVSGEAADADIEEVEEETLSGELPSVDSMSDSFTEVPLGEAPVTEVSDSGVDPTLMAQAIRTVLKREE